MEEELYVTCGYGINTDEIIIEDNERFIKYICCHPTLRDIIVNYILRGHDEFTGQTPEEILSHYNADDLIKIYSFADTTFQNLNKMIAIAIEDEIGVPMVAYSDVEDNTAFVAMPPYFPWDYKKYPILADISSEEDAKAIFAKHIAQFTDQDIDTDLLWDYRNGLDD